MLTLQKKRAVANGLYYGSYDSSIKNPKIKESNTDLLGDEKAFLDMVHYAGIGVMLFEANSSFTNFESITHDESTGNLIKTPCN